MINIDHSKYTAEEIHEMERTAKDVAFFYKNEETAYNLTLLAEDYKRLQECLDEGKQWFKYYHKAGVDGMNSNYENWLNLADVKEVVITHD